MFQRRQPVRVSADDLVQVSDPVDGGPLIITAAREQLDPAQWAAANRESLLEKLRSQGGVLLRGFVPLAEQELAAFVRVFAGDVMEYTYASTPRTRQSVGVYTATEYPPDQTIPLHNELAYSRSWPLRLAFLCVRPADEGGRTPLADCRDVYRGIPPDLRARFSEKGVLYVRNYVGRLDLPWQRVFGTSSKSEVEEFCARSSIEVEWRPNDGLRTRQRCPAVARHPESGEIVWFNQVALFYVSALAAEVRQSVTELRAEEDLPRHCFYGDGAQIAADDVGRIRQAYDESTRLFDWRVGDLLLLDNMLMAHGRHPYRGTRRLLVAMGGRVNAE